MFKTNIKDINFLDGKFAKYTLKNEKNAFETPSHAGLFASDSKMSGVQFGGLLVGGFNPSEKY